MKLYYIYFLLLLSLFNKATEVGTCQPLDEIEGTAFKSHGEIFTLRCSSHLSGDGIWNITKLNDTTQKLEQIEVGDSITKMVTDYEDAGIYCCTSNNSTESCCVHVTVISRPKIEFHIPMNGTAYIYQNYTASCMIHANPKMNVYISSTQDCDFQHEASQIGQYTTEATITINNITSACTVITCSANLFQEHRMLELLPPPKPIQATTLGTPNTDAPTTQPPNGAIINRTVTTIQTPLAIY